MKELGNSCHVKDPGSFTERLVKSKLIIKLSTSSKRKRHRRAVSSMEEKSVEQQFRFSTHAKKTTTFKQGRNLLCYSTDAGGLGGCLKLPVGYSGKAPLEGLGDKAPLKRF
jgi:hypothetical protein